MFIRCWWTVAGLSKWWTSQTSGESKMGGTIQFRFDGFGPDMQVTELRPGKKVAWKCVTGPDEWVGTDLTFDLTDSGGETVLLFAHRNWREPVEFMHHCSTKWAVFLLGLKTGLEGGKFTPYPDDLRISNWG